MKILSPVDTYPMLEIGSGIPELAGRLFHDFEVKLYYQTSFKYYPSLAYPPKIVQTSFITAEA